MAVKIRLSRIGKKHVPFCRIVAVDGRKKRDGAFLENLGTYDVLNSKLVQFHEDRLNHWISLGAIPTDAVKKLHKMHKNTAVATPVESTQQVEKKGAKRAPKKTTANV